MISFGCPLFLRIFSPYPAGFERFRSSNRCLLVCKPFWKVSLSLSVPSKLISAENSDSVQVYESHNTSLVVSLVKYWIG